MSRADRKKRRRQRLEMERQAEYEKAMSGVRRIGEDAHWWGSGEILLQISEFPSFIPGYVWDFREFDGELTLYVSYTDPERDGYFKPGYHKLSEEQDFLRPLYEEIAKLDVSMRLVGTSGCDGTTYYVRFNSGFCHASLSWWEEGPKEWQPFTNQVLEVIEKLKSITTAL